MKTAKLVIGIISIVLFAFIMFQSCAAGMSNAMEDNGEFGGSAGVIVGFAMLIAGIVGIATRNGGKGGSFTAGGFYIVAAIVGFMGAGSYADLNIWAGLCVAFAAVFIVGTILSKKSE